ncbi:c-type cytochrome [Pelagicoccus sp. SDUM812005]|uniref:c-type cytochrome n=1 Tax=Pelagicoccus sp. SDUM812005 TaxID=3041257 RepID=UPI0028102C24|nr:c-type cytochrome [Pelagicoccus sp. SDUM812005]MDQ8183217.1 c-type cytochrome [Pelagicoccus sp. SDUM812005]
MDRSLATLLTACSLLVTAGFAQSSGEKTFSQYCASCHGADGSGLLGPNLTDAEVLHGSELADIESVVKNGIPSKAMPAWGSVLDDNQIRDVAQYVQSIMGTNRIGPSQLGKSTVTPFPEGTLGQPYLIRTFMPTLGLSDETFPHHGKGAPTPHYNPRDASFDNDKLDPTIPGIPGAIAVNFGDTLSYCFDTTECRLLYTWSGPFLDMTDYWGEGEGGQRKRFGYLPKVLGPLVFQASAAPIFEGAPRFQAYRKENGVPVFEYTVGQRTITLKVEPTDTPGEARCTYSSSPATELSIPLPDSSSYTLSCDQGSLAAGTLQLSAEEAATFTLTLTPTPAAR